MQFFPIILLHAYGVIDSATSPYNTDSSKISSIFESPLSLVRAGGYFGGVSNVDANGYLWSSMAYDNNNVRYFYFSGAYINLWSDNSKYSGYSVRCVAE